MKIPGKLTLILLLGLMLRIGFPSVSPPSLNWDEISHGYNAYSILTTGKDEWGVGFPTIFRAYGDYKLPVYIYTTTVSIAAFGLNQIGVRLPSIIAGTFLIYSTYLLSINLLSFKEKRKNQNIALLSALLVAVEPWSFFISRAALEANLALALSTFALALFFKSFKHTVYLIPAALFFGLSVWTYNSYRFFTPALVVMLTLLYFDKILKVVKNPKIAITSFVTLSIFIVPMFLQMLNTNGQARYQKVAIVDEGAVQQIIQNRQSLNMNSNLERILFNRPTYFIKSLFKNYTSHFSATYLYVKGGTNYQFSVPNHGILYTIGLPFLLLGLFTAIYWKNKTSIFLFSWLLLGFIPSSLTKEAPHVLRSVTILPLPMILTSVGLVKALEILNKTNFSPTRKSLILSFTKIIFILSALTYFSIYFYSYPKQYSFSWQYGYEQSVKFIEKNYSNYDKIIMTKKYGEPHEFVLFYTKYNSNKYNADENLNRFAQSDWFWVDSFDKYYFVNDWQIPKTGTQFMLESKKSINCKNEKCLLITSPQNNPEGWKLIEVIYLLNNEPVFELYEN